MELEEETDNQNKNRRFSSFSTPKKFEIMEELREKIIKFFRLFQLNNTLFFPTLYQMMEILAKDFLFKIVSLSDFCAYLREFLLHALVIKEKR